MNVCISGSAKEIAEFLYRIETRPIKKISAEETAEKIKTIYENNFRTPNEPSTAR